MKTIKIASRQSLLAQHQARRVGEHIQAHFKDVQIQYQFKKSLGDKNLDLDLSTAPQKGVFTSDFDEDLKTKVCDLVVHSWKDLPIEKKPEIEIIGSLKREDPRDLVFLKKTSTSLNRIVLLTSSPRREYQAEQSLKDLLPFDCDLIFKSIRGNVPTRFEKFLNDEGADAYVVALAAWNRLKSESNPEFQSLIFKLKAECLNMILPLSLFPTAPAQGALAVEALTENKELQAFLSSIWTAQPEVQKERQVLSQRGGGCHLKYGATALTFGQEAHQVFFEQGHVGSEKIQTHNFESKKSDLKFKNIWTQRALKVERSYLPTSEGLSKAKGDLFFFSRHTHLTAEVQKILSQTEPEVWCAGIHTWRKLAAKNIWVTGCTESLGFDSGLFQPLTPSPKKVYLTHDRAEAPKGFTRVSTYHIDMDWSDFNEDELQQAEVCYWMSGELFLECLNKYPELKSKHHASGPGRTAQTLAQALDPDQQIVCLSEADFLKTHVQS